MKKILKTNPFLLFFFIFFLIIIVFFATPLKDKISSKVAKLFFQKFLKIEAHWDKLSLKIFPPHLYVENFKFPYGSVEKISIYPSFKIAHTKVFIYGLDLTLKGLEKGKGESKGMDMGFIFFEDLILQKCKIRFEDKEIPIEGNFKGFSLYFLKEKGFLNIKESTLNLPEIGEIRFSLKSSFIKEGKGLLFKRILINSREFSIKSEGKFENLKPDFSLNFDLNASLKPFLHFLNAGIDGNLKFKGNIRYKKNLNLKGKGKIEGTKFLEKDLPPLDLKCNMDLNYLDLDFYKEKNNGKIKLSLKEKNLSEIKLNLEKLNLMDLLSFFSIPPINYNKKIMVEGKYNFFGTKIEKGEGFINFKSMDNYFNGSGDLKDFSLENFKIHIKEPDIKAEMEAKLPFSSEENFYFSGEIKETNPGKIKEILKEFLPETGTLRGASEGNFKISGTYEDVFISSKIYFKDFFYEDIPFGDGEAEIEIYKEKIIFKNIDFKREGGVLEGSGSIEENIKFTHKNWHFPVPFSSILTGEGEVQFEPKFLICGNVNQARVDFFDFGEISFKYDYDGEVFNLIQLEGVKGKGILNLKGKYKEKFELEGNLIEFPLFENFNISSSLSLEVKEKDINFCAEGLIMNENFSFMPLNFYSSLKEGNFEMTLKNSSGFSFKTDGFLDGDFNFRTLSSFEIKDLNILPFMEFKPSVKGEGEISGNLKDLKKIKGRINISPFDLVYKNSPFNILEGLDVEIKDGNFSLKETPIFHELAYIEIKGNCSLKPKFKLKISGEADFGDEIVNYFVPQLQYDGMAGLVFSMEKSKDLKIEGNLNISGYKIGYLPVNFNLLNPKGKIILKENRIEIEKLEGFSGDGKFGLKGEVFLSKNLGIDRIMLQGESQNLRVSYLQGFTMFLDGKADFLWTEKTKQISGNFTLLEGNFTKEINLLSEIQKIITPQKTTIQSKNLPPINLNLNIDVPKSLKVKNQILNLTCTGNIQILGDLSNPIILGQLETLPKSEIYFNGVLYKIEYAKVIMSNPYSFDPVIEMEATSNIRSYIIHLKIQGTLSHLTPQFSSEPYLPEADIISLLATGKVASQESGTWLSGASLLISQQISEELSKRSSSIFGLDRIRIEPVFGESNITTARITAQKQLNPNCTLSYTYNPVENQKDIISLECNVSQDTYINLIQEEDGTYLFQIFQRKNL